MNHLLDVAALFYARTAPKWLVLAVRVGSLISGVIFLWALTL